MWTRRDFLVRGTASVLTLAAGGVLYRALAQDELPDGSQARNTITPATQEAIDRGLEYLARNQLADGSFGTGPYHGNVGITSLGGLAFMAGGHHPGRGLYGRAVTRALQFVLDNEQTTHRGAPAAGFLCGPNGASHGPMYGHGFGTLFLAEAHGMVHDRRLRERLRRALDNATRLIVNTQNHEGGWRYAPVRGEADLSVTICQIMALRAARNAGVVVPKKTVDNCIRYVQDCQNIHGDGGFRYMRQPGQTGFARTAAGVVALYSAGVYEGPAIEKGLSYMLQNCKPGDRRGGMRMGGNEEHYFYGHYYAVQAMWIAGGRYWREWYPAIRDELLARRGVNGGWNDGRGCTHYSTAMACIILQIPNNYLPIFQR